MIELIGLLLGVYQIERLRIMSLLMLPSATVDTELVNNLKTCSKVEICIKEFSGSLIYFIEKQEKFKLNVLNKNIFHIVKIRFSFFSVFHFLFIL